MRKGIVIGALSVALSVFAIFAFNLLAKPESSAASAGDPQARAATAPTLVELRRMQQIADAACRCEKQAGKAPNDQGCWANFEREVARFEHSEHATACMHESVAYVCFPSRGEAEFAKHCVFRERKYASCSEDEERQKLEEARAAADRACGT